MTTLGKQKILKQINRKHILNLLRSSGELSVSDISAQVNLSKPTIMKIMKYYMDKGYLIISGKGSSTDEGGKKPNIFKFNANGGYAMGMTITRYCQMLWMSNFTYPPESHYAATSSTSSPSTNFLFSSTSSIS